MIFLLLTDVFTEQVLYEVLVLVNNNHQVLAAALPVTEGHALDYRLGFQQGIRDSTRQLCTSFQIASTVNLPESAVGRLTACDRSPSRKPKCLWGGRSATRRSISPVGYLSLSIVPIHGLLGLGSVAGGPGRLSYPAGYSTLESKSFGVAVLYSQVLLARNSPQYRGVTDMNEL